MSAQHQPTPESKNLVRLHATIGTRHDVMADILGIDAKTLRKHYRTELDHSLATANATVGGALFNKAKGGDTAAMIFWMKTRAGWRETNVTEVTGANGGPIQTQDVPATQRLAERLAAIEQRSGTAGETASE